MASGWTYLLLAGLFEIAFATSLKLSDGFSRLWPSVSFAVTALASLALLNFALRSIPLGTAYAVWTGVGAVGTVIVGILWFRDPVTFVRMFFLGLIVAGVIGLRFFGGGNTG
jgi:quaternary ammonium compound-resistance protein SugE